MMPAGRNNARQSATSNLPRWGRSFLRGVSSVLPSACSFLCVGMIAACHRPPLETRGVSRVTATTVLL